MSVSREAPAGSASELAEVRRVIRRRAVPPGHGPWPEAMTPILQRVLAARGVIDGSQAQLRLARMLAPDTLGGMQGAAALLAEAVQADWHVVVVGDFDCDGATGTAVAVRGLRMLGGKRISYRVPNRVEHGYGLSPALVEAIAPMQPDLILTVDSGIACLAGVAAARARGWRVVVSDHHLPGEALPPADAIVNPNCPGDTFASKALAGVGVVFYLLLAVRAQLRNHGESDCDAADLSTLLDLVAVGTVADLVPLDYNNRLLVSAGLQRIRRGQCQPGLRALAECAGRSLETFCASDIGFGIAPRINAAGRLEDMALGIACLLADDPEQARQAARVLDDINRERKDVQQQMLDEAEQAIARLALPDGGRLPDALCLFDPGWHPGVVGLVAARIKERLHRPVIAFAPVEVGSDALRGSARSIPGFHIRDALAAVDAANPGLIDRFGGHAMAAGLSLSRTMRERFEAAFLAQVAGSLDPDILGAEIASDGPLAPDEYCRETALALRLSGPWGQSFPEPVFDDVFELIDWRVVGDRHLKLNLKLENHPEPLSAIHFGGWQGSPPMPRMRLAFQLDLDDFRGRSDIQLRVLHSEPA